MRANWHADWGRPPETILNGSHKYADGRLHDAAAALGANVTHLDWQWNYAAGVHHWQPRKPAHGLSLVPPKSALWLNWRGERIGPMPLVTGFDTHDLVAQICRQERAYSWQLLNRRIVLKELAISGGEFNPAFREQEAPAGRARHAARQPLALRPDDADLPGRRGAPTLDGTGRRR